MANISTFKKSHHEFQGEIDCAAETLEVATGMVDVMRGFVIGKRK